MSSFYRPSTKTTAQAAVAKLSRAERAAQEESNLNILRASIERTLWCLDPDSDLAVQLQETMLEIRRHSLATLLSEKAHKSRLESPPASPQTSLDNDSIMPDQIFEPSSPLHRGQPPRSIRKLPARSVSERSSRLRRDQLSRAGSGSNLRRDQVLPSIERVSDHTSDKTGSALVSIFDDAPENEQSATTKATSEMNTCIEEQPSPTKKRSADDDNETYSPVTKRVRTWLSQLTGGYME